MTIQGLLFLSPPVHFARLAHTHRFPSGLDQKIKLNYHTKRQKWNLRHSHMFLGDDIKISGKFPIF